MNEAETVASLAAWISEGIHNHWEEDHDFDVERVDAVRREFGAMKPAELGQWVAGVVKAVAETDCIGCREVIIRSVMMIEDIEGIAGEPHDRFGD
jgi:hypothetical protein